VIEEFKEIVWSLKEFVDIEEELCDRSWTVCGEICGFVESLEIFVVTLWSFSDNFEVIVIVNKTSLWWNWMIATAVLAEDIYCLYLRSLLYLGWSFHLSCLECPSVRIAIKSLRNSKTHHGNPK